MKLFDYIYFRTYSIYENSWNEKNPDLYAAGLVSLMQEFNLGAIFFLLFFYFDINISRVYVFLFYIVLFILNLIWYSKYRPYSLLFRKWNTEKKKAKTIKGLLVLIYFLFSFIVFYKTAIVVGRMMS
jgi:accessory gene regulator protein AgrB